MISIAVTALLVSASNAPPGEKFTWHDFTKAEDEIARRAPVGYFTAMQNQPVPAGYKAPNGVANARFFHLTAGNRRQDRYVACAAGAKEKSQIDTLYVDWNGDKKFGKGEVAKATTGTRYSDSAEYTFPVGGIVGSGSTRTTILILGGNIFTFMPTGGMRGKVDVDGKVKTALLIDTNCDGVYNDQSGYVYFDGDRAPSQIPGLMRLQDGSFWVPQVAPDGSRFTVVKDTRPTGTLAVKGLQSPGLTLSNGKGPIFVQLNDDEATLPMGDYTVDSLSLAEKEGDRTWNLMLYSGDKKVTVKGGEVTRLNVGKPLSLGVEIGGDAANKVFSLTIKDAAGLTVGSLYNDKGERPPAPVLKIKNANGEVVKSLPFTYG